MGRCLFFPYFRSSSSRRGGGGGEDGKKSESRSEAVVSFSYNSLRIAAQGFQSTNKIGEGGFGSVYKGKLRDGTVVAIKILSAKSVQGEREFLAEIESMKGAKHENLIRLRGYCAKGNNRILVYDYMERNSLAQTLLSGKRCDIDFTWAVRRKISLGIAQALTYLHEEIKPHIIHRDIKPSNILLDSDLTPKISDFGLAKLFPDNITHISTRVAGTIGYLAPEYARCGKVTRKSDVYSYGVLLLEIICGRSATNYSLGVEEYNIAEKAWELYIADQLLQLVDPSLSGDFPEQEAEQFLMVALLCVQEMASLRPPMSKVVKMLSGNIDTRGIQISRPGVISDLKALKIRQTTPAVKHTFSDAVRPNQDPPPSYNFNFSSESSSEQIEAR